MKCSKQINKPSLGEGFEQLVFIPPVIHCCDPKYLLLLLATNPNQLSSSRTLNQSFADYFFPTAVLITSMLKDINAEEKDTITFEVTVNYEGITYKWLKNGVEIKSTDRCQIRTKKLTHSLSIRNVHFGDTAEYTFVAGQAASAATLYVEGIPSFCTLYNSWLVYINVFREEAI